MADKRDHRKVESGGYSEDKVEQAYRRTGVQGWRMIAQPLQKTAP